MYGWVGNILKIDLSSGESTIEPTESYVEDYLGGRGLGVRLIYDNFRPGTDAFDPGNPLIFNTGPLSGTALPGSGRVDVTALSPMSKLRAKSNFGAYWGPELKFAGYDHVMITGKAASPCYIFINDGKVEIRDAAQLWGKDTFETQKMIQDELGDPEIKSVCIGPAGERCPGPFRLHPHRNRRRGGKDRHGRGHGIQEPEGRRRAGQRRHRHRQAKGISGPFHQDQQ